MATPDPTLPESIVLADILPQGALADAILGHLKQATVLDAEAMNALSLDTLYMDESLLIATLYVAQSLNTNTRIIAAALDDLRLEVAAIGNSINLIARMLIARDTKVSDLGEQMHETALHRTPAPNLLDHAVWPGPPNPGHERKANP